MMRNLQVAERLNEIAERNGGCLTPEDVVADARDKDSPLHEHFDWDIDRAAHQHWIRTARALISSVRIVVTNNKTTVWSPAYVRDPSLDGREQGYVSVVKLVTDTDLAREAVNAEVATVLAALRRAKNIAHALELDDALDELLGDVLLLQEKLERV